MYIFFNKPSDNEGKNYWGWPERKVGGGGIDSAHMYINKNLTVMACSFNQFSALCGVSCLDTSTCS